MKRVLIVSPNFPPVNSADMHRVRQSLPYFREMGWEPVVLAVDEDKVDAYSTDPLLLDTIPRDIEVHKTGAWDAKKTRKFGLGSLGIRAYLHLCRKGDELISRGHFDLVFFSTTAFHVMALGRRWKRKFGIPFILDIQDPWRGDFYLSRPPSERPPKFFITYNIDKWLEGRTVPAADGIISVSQGYCDTFLKRYPGLKSDQCCVIPFGASLLDFEVMKRNISNSAAFRLPKDKINILYVGRGGHDLRFALEIIFKAFREGLNRNPVLFENVRFWFAGTSYARTGEGQQTVLPVAVACGVGDYVTEFPDRVPYFETLFLLGAADVLVVPGSVDGHYTASKIYPYILTEKPLLAVFCKSSSVVDVLTNIHFGKLIVFNEEATDQSEYIMECLLHLTAILSGLPDTTGLDREAFEPYTAKAMTGKQVAFFNRVINSA